MRLARLLLSSAVVLLAYAPPVAADHTIYYEASGGGSCQAAGLDTFACSGSWSHFVWSDPGLHCAGAHGSYSSCNVFHECRGSASGVLAEGTLVCDFVGGDACGGTGTCDLYAGAYVTILAGECRDLALTLGVSGIGSRTDRDAPRVCVDGHGPYLG